MAAETEARREAELSNPERSNPAVTIITVGARRSRKKWWVNRGL
ncbi:MAG: hypothetical protein ACLPTQ_03845 [Terriglobales bacterium]